MRRWRQQTLPTITAGDFNFEPKSTDASFLNMTIRKAWNWIEPEQLLGSLPSGKLVDHVFTAGPAQDWPVSAEVIVHERDADSAVNADHKPVIALVGPEVVAPLIPCSTTSESCLFDELQPPVVAGNLVITKVDKEAEDVVIRNDGGAAVNLSGWVLLSEKGQQACGLGGVIEPGATLTISALGNIAGYNCGFRGNIWNNRERDPAALIAPDGTVVSRYGG